MNLANSVSSLIFPNRCILCSSKSSFLVCDNCIKKLNVGFYRCKKCSSPIPSEGLCSVCLKEKREFVRGFSLFNYNDKNVARIVEFIKFYGFFGLVNVVDCFKDIILSVDFFNLADCLIPVPMHKKSIRKRGFNQAVLIAKRLSKIVGVPVCYNCLAKIKQTKSQVGLSLKERKTNLRGAFKVLKIGERVKTVVIVDDVFTTGSTINEISKTLRDHGVESYFFTLASTPQLA